MNYKLIQKYLNAGYKVKRRHWPEYKYIHIALSEIYEVDENHILKRYKPTKADLKANNWLQIKGNMRH